MSLLLQGGRSNQGVILLYAGQPVQWEATRQPFHTMSTAESELVGHCEGLQMALSIESLLEVVYGEPGLVFEKWLAGDNTTAIGLMTRPDGPWRTRHLRLRANCLKEKLNAEPGDWKVFHQRGSELCADYLTKPIVARSSWGWFWRFMSMEGDTPWPPAEELCPTEESSDTKVMDSTSSKSKALQCRLATAAAATAALGLLHQQCRGRDPRWGEATAISLAALWVYVGSQERIEETVQEGVQDRNGTSVQKGVQDRNGTSVQEGVQDRNGTCVQQAVQDRNGNGVQDRNGVHVQGHRRDWLETVHSFPKGAGAVHSLPMGATFFSDEEEWESVPEQGTIQTLRVARAEWKPLSTWWFNGLSVREKNEKEKKTCIKSLEGNQESTRIQKTVKQLRLRDDEPRSHVVGAAGGCAVLWKGAGSSVARLGGGSGFGVGQHPLGEGSRPRELGCVDGFDKGKPLVANSTFHCSPEGSLSHGASPQLKAMSMKADKAVMPEMPWNQAAFEVPPTGSKDKWSWLKLGRRQFLVRAHSGLRQIQFHPIHGNVPVQPRELTQSRTTVKFMAETGEKIVEHDNWLAPEIRTKGAPQWRGYTFFQVRVPAEVSDRPDEDFHGSDQEVEVGRHRHIQGGVAAASESDQRPSRADGSLGALYVEEVPLVSEVGTPASSLTSRGARRTTSTGYERTSQDLIRPKKYGHPDSALERGRRANSNHGSIPSTPYPKALAPRASSGPMPPSASGPMMMASVGRDSSGACCQSPFEWVEDVKDGEDGKGSSYGWEVMK